MTNSETTAGTQAGTAEASIDTSSTTPATVENVRFEDLGLAPEVLRAVAESGYTTPTPIQAQGIPHVLKRRDIIGIAQTGTGKTASFTLPMIELLARGRAKARMPRSLILEPTRELAAQVAENFERYGKFNKLSMALLIGGVSFDDQEKKLDRGVDVLIATPGRLLDHFERGKLMLSQVQILVIDEADRMLDMGFIPDVERICKLIPFTRQTLFYSATMPPEIQRLTEQFLHNPVKVEVSRPATAAANITQEAIDVPANDWAKREALRRLLKEAEPTLNNAIVFCNRKRDVDVVAKSLQKHGFNAAPLHGDLDQSLRTKTLDSFRSGELKILIASDVAARGLDIPAVSHVLNYDVPFHADDYVHRIGRTGRAGRSGHTYMLVTPRDDKYVEAIERLIKTSMPHRKLEGLAEAVSARPADEQRSGGRGGDRNRGGRGGRGRDRTPRRDHAPKTDHRQEHRAQNEPREMLAKEIPQHTPEPLPPDVQPQAQAPVQHEPRPAQQHSQPKPHASEQREHRGHEQRGPRQHNRPAAKPQQNNVQQNGPQAPKAPGHDASKLPAFLMRPVKLPEKAAPKTPRKKEDAE